jgi:hypothetical protein
MRQLLRYAIVCIPVVFSVGLAVAKTPNCNCQIPNGATSCVDPKSVCEGQDPCPATGLYGIQQYSLGCGVNKQGSNTCVAHS